MPLPTTNCRGCGKPVLWAVTKDGRSIPLDPRPATYQLLGMEDANGKPVCRRANGEGDEAPVYTTHFATCPEAGRFSGSGKAAAKPSDGDPLLDQARRAVQSAGQASTGVVMRKLTIGYGRSARLLELLEEEGTVGPVEVNGIRPLLKKGEEVEP